MKGLITRFLVLLLMFCPIVQKETLKVQALLEPEPVSVVSGSGYTFLVLSDGSLWSWGSDSNEGVLGEGGDDSRSNPERIMTDVMQVATHDYYSDSFALAVKNDNSLWGWGDNQHGQLGNGEFSNYNKIFLPFKIMDGVSFAAAGAEYSLAIKLDGSLWAWGMNGHGQLGTGDNVGIGVPEKVMEGVASVATGDSHTLVIKKDGSLWAFGNNESGQLGDGTLTDRYSPVKIMDGVVSISASNSQSFAIKQDKSLWAWGLNENGQLGNGTYLNQTTPIQILTDVTSVNAGYMHTIARKSNGSLWAWGYNGSGQLGNNSKVEQLSPIKVLDYVKTISAGSTHTIIIKEDKTLWGWGGYSAKLFPNETAADQLSPKEIIFEVPLNLTLDTAYLNSIKLSAGSNFSTLVKADKSLWTWGNNQYGQLGMQAVR